MDVSMMTDFSHVAMFCDPGRTTQPAVSTNGRHRRPRTKCKVEPRVASTHLDRTAVLGLVLSRSHVSVVTVVAPCKRRRGLDSGRSGQNLTVHPLFSLSGSESSLSDLLISDLCPPTLMRSAC